MSGVKTVKICNKIKEKQGKHLPLHCYFMLILFHVTLAIL